MLKWAVAMAGAALAIGVLGCGGGDDSSPPVTKAVFVKKANSLCKETTEKLRTEVGVVLASKEDESAQIKKVAELSVPRLESEREEIEALGTPKGDEDQIEEILDAYDAIVEKVEEDPERFVNQGHYPGIEQPLDRYGIELCPLE